MPLMGCKSGDRHRPCRQSRGREPPRAALLTGQASQPRSGVEVDFVVYGAEGLWAIEVKNSDRLRPEDLRGLETFGTDYPKAELVLHYRGPRRERRGRVWVMPVDRFLDGLHPARTMPMPA
jgi:hypothetical protein